MTNGQKTNDLLNPVHASNSRGIKYCGSRISGDQRINVATYPERWSLVTCVDCLTTREN